MRLLHSFGFAVAPIVALWSVNLSADPVDMGTIGRAFLVAIAATAVGLYLLSRTRLGGEGAAIWMATFWLVFINYGFVAGPILGPDAARATGARPYAVAYVILASVIATLVSAPLAWRRSLTFAYSVMALIMIVPGATRIVWTKWHHARAPWRSAVQRLVSAPPVQSRGTDGHKPDIYYLVLDGFGRPDVLKEKYRLDISAFVKDLEARGYTVPPNAHANYAHTFQSLASTLNFDYLHDIAATMPPGSRDPTPLKAAIDGNAYMRLAAAQGYRTYAVGSDFSVTRQLPAADVCYCGRVRIGSYAMAVASNTPLAPFITPLATDRHRAWVREQFEALRTLVAQPSPKLVFLHASIPHPPFVFNADGSNLEPPYRFTFADGLDHPGSVEEYVRGYAAQVSHLTNQLDQFTQAVQSEDPSAIVVMHGDHGPAAGADLDRGELVDPRERLTIFLAYRFPTPDRSRPPAVRSPVNLSRLVASRYLGATFSPLSDDVFFSPADHLYEFSRVDSSLLDD